MNQLEYYKSKPEDFLIKKHSTKDLYLVKYINGGIDWSQPYALEARGIVLDGESNVVSRPYKKFFNHNELKHRDDLPREIKRLSYWTSDNYMVIEKLDGSLAVVSKHKGELLFTSSGSIEGEYPKLFESWFRNNLDELQMEKLNDITENYTLIFEYISPKHRIVVKYGEEAMILHGAIHTKTGKEIDRQTVLSALANGIGVDTARVFNLSFSQIARIKKQEFEEDLLEGFVIKFDNGKRLKIKTDEYLRLHPEYTADFGRFDTKRKVKMYINRIEEDTVDDLIAVLEEKESVDSIYFINKVIKLYKEFDKLLKVGYTIVNQEGFTKSNYAKSNGNKELIDKIVLNIDKEDGLKKLREKFIFEQLEKMS